MDVSASSRHFDLVQVSRQCLVHTRHADDWNKAPKSEGSDQSTDQHGKEKHPVIRIDGDILGGFTMFYLHLGNFVGKYR